MASASFSQALFRQVGIFVLIPALFVIGFSMVTFYRAQYELAENNTLSQNRSLASLINGRLTRQQYLAAGLSQDKGLGEIAVNILYSQFVDKKIQQFVQQNPLVNAAFMIDNKGFLLSGYPLSTLKVDSAEISKLVKQTFSQTRESQLPRLHFLSRETLRGYIDDKSPHQGHLALVNGVTRATESLIKPMQTTAVLFVLLDAQQLLLTNNEVSRDQVEIINQLVVADKPLLSKKVSHPKWYFNAKSLLDYQLHQEQQTLPVALVSYQRKSDYLSSVYTNIGLTLAAIFLLMLFAYSLVKYWLKKLHAPLHEIVMLSQQIAKGDYRIANSKIKFIEFEHIHEALAKMAQQIDGQLVALTESRQKAESSDRLKSQFLANMSHEIRTPMNGVLGILQVMQSQMHNEPQRKMLNTAMLASQNLLAILNDILDFSKIEADELVIEHIAFSPKEVVESVYAIVATQCLRKGLQLNISLSDEFEKKWVGDPLRLTQVLQNLLSNAIKFTPEGIISLNGQIQFLDGQHLLYFCVRDQGIGLSQEQLTSLFTPFKQADSSTTRHYGGTGLGLSISHKLVTLMGGTLNVESQIEQGATFTFKVQVSPVSVEPAPSPPLAQQRPILTGRRIMVAEDNEINQEILKLMLAPTEAELWFVSNGQEALDAYAQCQPELILMDVQMPTMDGLTATKRLRANACQVPIIFQTANISSDDILQYRSAGADEVLAKPTDMAQLYRVLTQFMLTD